MRNNIATLSALASLAIAQGTVAVKRLATNTRTMSEHDIAEQVVAVRDYRAQQAFERRLASQLKGERA